MPISSTDHSLIAAKERSQNSRAEVGLPCQRRTRLKVVTDKVEGVFALRIANRSEGDRWVEDLSCERGLFALFQIVSRTHNRIRWGQNGHHELALVFDRRYGRAPGQPVRQSECGLDSPCVLRIQRSLIVPDSVLEVGAFRQELKCGITGTKNCRRINYS